MTIHLPPLHERREDISLLLGHFTDLGRADGLPEFCAGDDVMRAMMSYDWPGNTRERKHCVDRMAALRSEGALRLADMPSALQNHAISNSPPGLADVLEQHPFREFVLNRLSPVISIPDSEPQTIRHALAQTGGERAKAAAHRPHHVVPQDETIRDRVTVALDATYSIGDELSGVGVYSRELMGGLARAHPEVRFLYCYRPHRFPKSWRERLPGNARRALLTDAFGLINSSWRKPPLFHGLNQRLPAVRCRRTVVTFHDLFVLTGDYSTAEFRARFAAQAREAAARADLILTVSAFTKSQLTGLLGVEPGRIRVVHHGIRPLPLAAGADSVERDRIILHVGAIQKRKNIARLVEAFEAVDRSWRLVLAGSNGYGSDEILGRIASSIARDRILATGYIPAPELARWYGRASIFAFPSLDEGFGMPVLEAMAAGIPVVTSNRSALPEVAGDAALLVNPEDTGALSEALRELTRDIELRFRLAAAGRKHATAFSWEKTAEETWASYQNLLV